MAAPRRPSLPFAMALSLALASAFLLSLALSLSLFAALTPASAQSTTTLIPSYVNNTRYPSYCSYLGQDFTYNFTAPVLNYTRMGSSYYTSYYISMCVDQLANVTGNSLCQGAAVCQCEQGTCYGIAQFDNAPLWSYLPASGANYVQLGTNLYCGMRRETTLTFQCGVNTSVVSYSEVSICRYQFILTSPLACAMSSYGSTGVDVVENYDYCTFQNRAFYTSTEPASLELSVGSGTTTNRYFLSLCVDRLATVTGSTACAGSTLCRCTSSGTGSCQSLATMNLSPLWTPISSSSVQMMQYGPATGCGYLRETTVTFQCDTVTAFDSIVVVTSCIHRLVVRTPLACGIQVTPPVDIPEDYAYCTFAGRDFASLTQPLPLTAVSGSYTFFLSMCLNRLQNHTGSAQCANATVCQCATTSANNCYRTAEMDDIKVWTLISPSVANYTQLGDKGSCPSDRVTEILFTCSNTTTFTISEASTCVYRAVVNTPLACQMSLPVTSSSTGGAGYSLDYGYCSYQGQNFAGTTQPTSLTLTVGTYTYYVSMCVDRLASIANSVTCAGASVCRCQGTTCEALAQFNNAPLWTSPTSNSASYLQLGSLSGCGFRRETTVVFQCGTTTALFSATQTSTCMYRLVITTPLACSVTNATAADIPNDWSYCTFAGRDFASVTEPNWLSYYYSDGNTYFLSMCTDRLANVTGAACQNATMCQCDNNSGCHRIAEMFDTYSWTYVSPNQANFMQLGSSENCGSDRVVTIQFVCGATNTFNSIVETATCRYLANVSTPLACGLSNPAVLPSSTGAAAPLVAYPYCAYQSKNFTSLTLTTPFVLVSGTYTYYVSMCVDRLATFIPATACAGASVCRCQGNTCEALSTFDNVPSWRSPVANATSYLQLGPTTGCGFRREVTINYQCGADSTILSVVETSTCMFSVSIRTPLACGIAAVPDADVPNDWAYCAFAGRDFASVTEPNVLMYHYSDGNTYFLSMCTDRLQRYTGMTACANATMCQCDTNGCHRVAEMFDTYSWSLVSPNQANFVQLGSSEVCGVERQTTIQFVCGTTNTFNSIVETATCRYLANVSTPLACGLSLSSTGSIARSSSVAVLPSSSVQASSSAAVQVPSSSSGPDVASAGSSSSSISSGAIAGAVIGAIFGVLLVLVALVMLLRARKNKPVYTGGAGGGDRVHNEVEMSQAGAHVELEEETHEAEHETSAAAEESVSDDA